MCQIEPEGHCTVWNENTVKRARKRHRCDACSGFIQIGDSYLDHFSTYDGDATSEKMCPPCQVARDEFKKDHGWFPTPSSFGVYLDECIDMETDFFWSDDGERVDRPTRTAQKWIGVKKEMSARRAAAQEQL